MFLFTDGLAKVTIEKPSRETPLQSTTVTEGINVAVQWCSADVYYICRRTARINSCVRHSSRNQYAEMVVAIAG